MSPTTDKLSLLPDALHDLPEVLETKVTLGGVTKRFKCRAVERDTEALVVLFVAEVRYTVQDVDLPPGTITFGHFWAARPYNVYHWLTPTGTTIAHYANLSANTRFEDQALHWRDLTVDVLLRPGAPPAVLDEDELPRALPSETRNAIDAALVACLAEMPALVHALEAKADALWARIFGRARR